MKTLTFEKTVRNVDGLFQRLKELGPIVSVGSDSKKTYVYVDDTFPGDPKEIVESWEDTPELEVTSTSPLAEDGIPVAASDGVDSHTIVVRKVTPSGDLVKDSGRVIVQSPHPVTISEKRPRFHEGVTSFVVGPSELRGEALIYVSDTTGIMKKSFVRVKFDVLQGKKVSENTPEPQLHKESPEAIHPPSENSGIFSKIRNMLGF